MVQISENIFSYVNISAMICYFVYHALSLWNTKHQWIINKMEKTLELNQQMHQNSR